MKVNLFNSKNPNGKTVPVTVIIEHVDLVQTNDGELVYLIVLHAGARAINGRQVEPVYINNVTKSTILLELQKGLALLAEQIDWGVLEDDTIPPQIVNMYPKSNQKNVSIDSNVYLTLRDPFPASFIDLSTLKLLVNNIDVSGSIKTRERSNEVKLEWVPTKIKN
jgi:hypothetical protein